MKKILVILDSKFPYGIGETFLESEVKFYRCWDEIYIYPINLNTKDKYLEKREIPKNIEVIDENKIKMHDMPHIYKAQMQLEMVREYFHMLMEKNVLNENIVNMKTSFDKSMKIAIKLYSFLSHCGMTGNDKVVFYAYWMREAAIACAFLKIIYKDAVCITRCHGYDLYKERAENLYQPFRYTIFKKNDYICPISIGGAKYLFGNWNINKKKVKVFRLGTLKTGEIKKSRKRKFVLFSCSSVIELKRVDRIADVLSYVTDIEIEWFHFGDGVKMEKLREKIEKLPQNISCTLKGNIPNQEVLKAYAELSPDLFIHLSSTEGIPVSIMEACSMGVPILATDVGGTSEVVLDGYNGFLVDKDFKDKDVAELIKKYFFMSGEKKSKYGMHSLKVWKKRYSGEENYMRFNSWLLGL